MMRKTNEGQSPVGILLPSVLAGLLGTLLLMLLGAGVDEHPGKHKSEAKRS